MFTKVVRRIHMYLALFLMPWMLIYALSTLLMNHHEWVSQWYSTQNPAFVVEKEISYAKTFSGDALLETIAGEVLRDLGMDGAHNVRGGEGKPIIINRFDPIAQKRITYDPAQSSVLVEREEYRTPAFLGKMHRRRGYQHPYLTDDAWGFSVDLAVLAMMFWCLSGIWMWWNLRTARKWAGISMVSGFALFALFLALI